MRGVRCAAAADAGEGGGVSVRERAASGASFFFLIFSPTFKISKFRPRKKKKLTKTLKKKSAAFFSPRSTTSPSSPSSSALRAPGLEA